MSQITDEEVVRLGNLSEALMRAEGFHEIVDYIQRDLSERFLASHIHDKEGREHTFLTYDGLRTFTLSLKALMSARDATIERNSQNDTQEDD